MVLCLIPRSGPPSRAGGVQGNGLAAVRARSAATAPSDLGLGVGVPGQRNAGGRDGEKGGECESKCLHDPVLLGCDRHGRAVEEDHAAPGDKAL